MVWAQIRKKPQKLIPAKISQFKLIIGLLKNLFAPSIVRKLGQCYSSKQARLNLECYELNEKLELY